MSVLKQKLTSLTTQYTEKPLLAFKKNAITSVDSEHNPESFYRPSDELTIAAVSSSEWNCILKKTGMTGNFPNYS